LQNDYDSTIQYDESTVDLWRTEHSSIGVPLFEGIHAVDRCAECLNIWGGCADRLGQ
jgi:hypothetical protein